MDTPDHGIPGHARYYSDRNAILHSHDKSGLPTPQWIRATEATGSTGRSAVIAGGDRDGLELAGCSLSQSSPRADLCGERQGCQPPLWANRVNRGNRPQWLPVATGSILASPLSTSRRKLLSGGRDLLLPDEHTPLRAGDRILFAG